MDNHLNGHKVFDAVQATSIKAKHIVDTKQILHFLPVSESAIVLNQQPMRNQSPPQLPSTNPIMSIETLTQMQQTNVFGTIEINAAFGHSTQKDGNHIKNDEFEHDKDFLNVLSSLLVADFDEDSSFSSEFQDVLKILVSG